MQHYRLSEVMAWVADCGRLGCAPLEYHERCTAQHDDGCLLCRGCAREIREDVMSHDELGRLEAADGWSIDWDIRALPHRIDVFNADGVPQYRISGDIGRRYLERETSNFLYEHALQQLEMELT